MARIAVAGATGRVGRQVVDVLHADGHDVVAISRAQGVDVITGDGLAAALDGVESIIDTATGPSPEQQAATEFFTTAAGRATWSTCPRCAPSWSRPGRSPRRSPPLR